MSKSDHCDPVLLFFDKESPALVGEGPVWDPDSSNLYWIDIVGKKIFQYDPGSQINKTIYKLDKMIGCIGMRQHGGLVAALEDGLYVVDKDGLETKKDMVQVLSRETFEPNLPHNRFNDGKCDPMGRFWAGTNEITPSKPLGALYRFSSDSDGRQYTASKQVSDAVLPNGIAWADQTMFWIDSLKRSLYSFRYDPITGNVSDVNTLVHFPESIRGVPDGMTIDSENCLWIAFYDGARVERRDAETGKLLKTIPFPVDNPSSCTFGGPSLSSLYVTTAALSLDPNAKQNGGGLYVVKNTGCVGRESSNTPFIG